MSVDLVTLDSLFEVHNGTKLDLNKMQPPSSSESAVAFVSRSGENNGLASFVERLENVEPFAAGLITVALGGSALSSFVQPRRFYTAQNIVVLEPFSHMTLDVKLYYCLCVVANRFRYSTYGREANRTVRSIRVPALHEVPNWVNGVARASVERFAGDLLDLAES